MHVDFSQCLDFVICHFPAKYANIFCGSSAPANILSDVNITYTFQFATIQLRHFINE